jgi:hypothetical protein
MSATLERDAAMQLAKTDFPAALRLARKVSQPWFCCQALAGVARYAPEESVIGIAEEAFAAALEAPDAYNQTAVMAWPLRALIERGYERRASEELPKIMKVASQIEIPVSRSEALMSLWQAFFPLHDHKTILAAFLKSCVDHRRADYMLRQVIMILASENVEAAHRVADSMREGQYKRQAKRLLAEGRTEKARGFYY